jgi:Ca2+-binding EF-hand superfamily protein
MNKRLFILLVGVVVVMLAVGPAMAGDKAKAKDAAKAQETADLFVAIDTDKDGKISQAEYLAYTKDKVKGEKEFKMMDKNGDTYLVKEEFTITKLPKKAKSATKAAPKKAPAAK